MRTIFDIITSKHIASYWTTKGNSETNFTESLFPASKQLGLDLKWIKGARGMPIVLKMSAFDAAAVPRARVGFIQKQTQMPYIKESMYIDEELRQQLNLVLETGNQMYIDSVMGRVFDDTIRLLQGAAARREQMRAMVLTTGTISIVSNGQNFEYDYGVTNKSTAAVPWATTATADPMEDLRNAKEKISAATGEVLTRAMCDGKSWKNLRNNVRIRSTIFSGKNVTNPYVSDRMLHSFILDEVGLNVVVNDNHYIEEDGTSVRYVPDNTFSMFPSGALGSTWFGTTPAESDLSGGKIANVSIVDTGVAITTVQKADPVQVETIVSQICLPSFERAESVYILNTGN